MMMAWQKCPVCDGTGLVSRPPYIAGDQPVWSSTSSAPYPCKRCKGTGTVAAGDEPMGLAHTESDDTKELHRAGLRMLAQRIGGHFAPGIADSLLRDPRDDGYELVLVRTKEVAELIRDALTVAGFVAGWWPGLEDGISWGSDDNASNPVYQAAQRIVTARSGRRSATDDGGESYG